MDVPREDGERLEEDSVAKWKDSIYLFGGNRDAAVIAAVGYIPTVGHLLQHSWWSARRCVLLGSNEIQKASVKRYRTVIYWERKLPALLGQIKNLFDESHTSSW